MSTLSRFLVGIDLGTTNCALAYIDRAAPGRHATSIRDFPVPQLVSPGETAARRLLPSCAYLPGEHELPSGATRLPWGERPVVVGEFARLQGARVPGRLVVSAKSWLSHPGVDRTAKILPWGAPEVVRRISPVKASALYLTHLREAWDHQFPEEPLSRQEVVLTVPASFDEVARELTVLAAREAGLEKLTLLEEPQAAFYSFAARHRHRLREALGDHRLILVCDVGGGTTDFTLIHASLEGENPKLERLAVGDHLLLGGDNIDVALARRVEPRLGGRIDAAQWSMLQSACRAAKETLLSDLGPEKLRVAVAGRGSRMVGRTLSAELTREEVVEVVLDGFFPRTSPDERPTRMSRAGLQELGLPYASDPAVTRHLAAFLQEHAAQVEEALGVNLGGRPPRPDAILVNGGVFTPPSVGERLREVVSGWFPERKPVALLATDALDLVVARGAAWYGLVRRGQGLRIGGGTARAYFVGIEAPGSRARELVCLIPRHLEEQVEIEIPRPFALVLGRPVRFPLYATSRAPAEHPGDLATLDEEVFEALPPIETVLQGAPSDTGGEATEVPVRLRALLTEIGTLELWCAALDREARWKLEFRLRGAGDEEQPSAPALPKRYGEARALVERLYGTGTLRLDLREVKSLPRELERILGPRSQWPIHLLRELWSVLHAVRAGRRHSPEHERVWFGLCGFCLRPGFGAPLDDWRAAETFQLFDEGLQFPDEAPTWSAWWLLWRRVAGGLGAAAQSRILDRVASRLKPGPAGLKEPRNQREGQDEMIRLVGSLERLSVAAKLQIGQWLLERVERDGPTPPLLWAIGRLGARVPFYGSANASIPAPQAAAWAKRLLALPRARPEDLALALALLTRRTGDRARDVEPALRARVEARLVDSGAPQLFLRMVREVVELGAVERQRFFGESLPAGLKLLPETQQ
jgi:molecular chaperone DnaK (HSP70)